MEEVRTLHEAGHDSIFFIDDHFLGDPRHARALLAELTTYARSHDHRPIFYCQATVNVATQPEMLEKLYQANFRRLFIGIESDDLIALRSVNKGHNTKMSLVDAVREIQRYNITVWAALLGGFDRDTPAVFDRYLEFARDAGIGMVIPGLLQAVPGTEYHRRMSDARRLIPLRNGYVAGQAGSLDSLPVTNVAPLNMTMDELVTGFRRFCGDLYEPDAYADRIIESLRLGTRAEPGGNHWGDLWASRDLVGRMLKFFAWDGDAANKRVFRRIVQHLIRTRFHRTEEALMHILLYKHLREFYRQAAEAEVPIAPDLLPAPAPASP
jgi:radical SAM superfamily enzyme YgiQ (UPF0313 family)